MHFRDGLGDWLMFDRNAVRGDHDSCTISAASAVNEYFRIRVRANQVEEFDDLWTCGFAVCVPGNLNIFDSQRFNLAPLCRHFRAVIAEIDHHSNPHRVQCVESIPGWLSPAIKIFSNVTEIGQAPWFLVRLAPRDFCSSKQRHNCQKDDSYNRSAVDLNHHFKSVARGRCASPAFSGCCSRDADQLPVISLVAEVDGDRSFVSMVKSDPATNI
jgi:hypothetical protein